MGLLSLLETRASPENPTTSLADPATFLFDAWGASPVNAGVNLSEKTAMRYTAVFACIRVISETLGTLPLNLYERLEPRGKRKARDHRLFSLLHDQPNPEMNSVTFFETLTGHIAGWGNAFAEIEYKGGNPVALWPLLPDRTKIVRVKGEKWLITRINNEDIPLAPGRYLHVPGFGFNGVTGYSPIRQAKEAIGLGLATEEYGARFFGQGARPAAVIKHPGALSPDAQQRIRSNLEILHQGLKKSHRLAVLEEGMSIEALGLPNDDSQFLETRRFQIEDVARVYRMPLHKISDLTKADFSNIEQQSIEFVTDTIRPYAVRWEKAINQALLTDEEREDFFAEFLIDGLLRGDSKARNESYAIGRQWGWLSANDVLEFENLNPIGDQGDIYMVPMNMVPAEQVTQTFDSSERSETRTLESRRHLSAVSRHRLQQAQVRLMEKAASDFVVLEVRAALRALTKAFGSDKPIETFLRLMEEFYRKFSDAIVREFLPVLRVYAELLGTHVQDEVAGEQNPLTDPGAEVMVAKYADDVASVHVKSAQNQIRDLISKTEQDELQGALEERFKQWEKTWPGKIAQRESVQAAGAFTKFAFAAVGLLTVRWLAVGESCPLCNRMNGRVVGMRENFLEIGHSVDPQDGKTKVLITKEPIAHPPLHRGCDCILIS